MVAADSDRIPRVPPYSGAGLEHTPLPVRAFHPLWTDFPDGSSSWHVLYDWSYNPGYARDAAGLGSSHFDRHYFGNRCFFLFLQVLRCFSSLRLRQHNVGDWPSTSRVTPFGHLRINSCLQIPGAFRSLPRPSSLPEAKASSVRSCSLSRTYK